MTDTFEVRSDPYASIVALYDLEHDDFDDDAALILQLAESGLTPVLELGCGSGRIIEYLIDSEIEVTGLDSSPLMLDAARTRLQTATNRKLATLVTGDMRHLEETKSAQFGLIAYSLNALMHLETSDEQITSLTSARCSLSPEGVVFIDLMNPHPEQLVHLGSGAILEGAWQLETGESVDKWSHRTIHPADQTIDTTIWYDTISEGGQLQRTRTSFVHRYLHASELRLMLMQAGYTEISFYGSYELDAFDDDSDRLIVLARCSAA